MVGYHYPGEKYQDLAIKNAGVSTIDIRETPCRAENGSFEFGFELDSERSVYSRKIVTYFDQFLTVAGPILAYLSGLRLLSSNLMYKHF